MLEETLQFIRTNMAPIVAMGSAAIAWWALRANHDWNRRNYALQICSDWNAKTSKHRQAIENRFPGLVDKDSRAGTPVEITKQIAQTIYSSKPGTPDWEIRFHLIELGNHLEFISTAYINHVADKEIVETAFKSPIIRWHEIMANFIKEVEEHRKYRPWKPWDDVVAQWNNEIQKKRKKTA